MCSAPLQLYNRVRPLVCQLGRQFSFGEYFKGKSSPSKAAKAAKDLQGESVWVPDEEACFVLGTVAEVKDDGSVVATTKDGNSVVIQGAKHMHDPRDESEADLVQMAHVDTPNILNTLRVRHAAGAVYTNVGAVGILISVNPYTWMDIYGTDVMREHYESFGTKELPPHVFSLASDAYKALAVHGKSQCLVTSGESGSGKTENSKQVFRFLAEIAGVQRTPGGGDVATADGSGAPVSMQDLLIHSNPVLEAFGNAKTVRNDNSSRFGKLVTVHFDGSGKIIGAFTRNYLLERTRVSAAPSGERNYHAFYQILAGATADEKSSRELTDAKDYALVRGGVLTVDGLDDAKEWRTMRSSMDELGFEASVQLAVFDVIAALLHIGNCEFTHDATVAHGDNAAKLADPAPIAAASKLFGVEKLAFSGAMISQQVRDQCDQPPGPHV